MVVKLSGDYCRSQFSAWLTEIEPQMILIGGYTDMHFHARHTPTLWQRLSGKTQGKLLFIVEGHDGVSRRAALPPFERFGWCDIEIKTDFPELLPTLEKIAARFEEITGKTATIRI